MDSISVRLLPWPAFKITNLAVGEDPGFGAEPALRAPEVIAEPRLWSLWRGRFELARVELTDASVNLVRNADGRWNISSVLLQASHVENAPTAQRRSGPAPRFPYIEATGTRINLKRGVEKLPYSLLNADFSMSLESPQVWRISLEGQPVRTDLELFANDTGVLRIEGDLHRASALGAMPVKLDAEWRHASLGQLSRILLGRDAGWRGDIDATAHLEGEFDRLRVQTHFTVANLHRQEFTPERAFAVDASCRGLYSRSTPRVDAFRCRWPLGVGGLLLSGSAAPSTADEQRPEPLFRLDVNRVSAGVLASALGLARAGAPDPARFTGELTGSYEYRPMEHLFTGEASMPTLAVAQAGLDGAPLTLTGVRLSAPEPPRPGRRAGPNLFLSSDPIALGVPAQPMAVSAQLTGAGYRLQANGAGTLPRLQAIAAALGLPKFGRLQSLPTAGKPSGARLALSSSGAWLGGERATSGSAHLDGVRWQPGWLPFPVDLPSADATLSPGLLRWTVAEATAGGMRFTGTAQMPLRCGGAAPCMTRFALSTPSLDAASIQAALTGGRSELLEGLLDRFDSTQPHLPALAGSIHAGVLTLGRLPVREATAVLSTTSTGVPAVEFQNLDGRALGGALHLQGKLSLAGGTPEYRLQGSISGAGAAQAAALWDESWGAPTFAGMLNGTVDLRLRGGAEQELLASARGTFQASWQHGAPAPPVFRFASWDGTGTITGDGLRIGRSTFSGTPATVSGTIGWDRSLALELTPEPGASPVAITGTLAKPLVEAPTE